jgi:seryl-tRNA synthetase
VPLRLAARATGRRVQRAVLQERRGAPASSEDTARELKEVKEELKGLKDTARELKEGMRALLQAQGIPAERLPLLMDDLSA